MTFWKRILMIQYIERVTFWHPRYHPGWKPLLNSERIRFFGLPGLDNVCVNSLTATHYKLFNKITTRTSAMLYGHFFTAVVAVLKLSKHAGSFPSFCRTPFLPNITKGKTGYWNEINQKFIFNYTVVPRFYSCFRWPSSNPWNSSVEPCGFDWTQFKNHCFTVLTATVQTLTIFKF